MSQKNLKNHASSVKQKLLNKSKTDKRQLNELLQYYAMERFLYRLSQSPYFNRFILKGALMLRAWKTVDFRPTMDIDLLGVTSSEELKIVSQIKEILSIEMESDGLWFDLDSIKSERILEEADYPGVQIKFNAKLGSAIIRIQIDIGFGDIVYPEPVKTELPTLLDFPAPTLWCYTLESAIAEKFDAMVSRGFFNSRIKDFYDIWILSRQFNFDGEKLAEAIRLTFAQRTTKIEDKIVAFSKEFIETKQTQWTTFRNRLQQEHIPLSFSEIVSALEMFLEPISSVASSGKSMSSKWNAPGPWS